MAIDPKKLNQEFKKRDGNLPDRHISVYDLDDMSFKMLNDSFNVRKDLGIVLDENGKVPVRDGVPRIFVMQPNENGVDTMKSLDDAGLKPGTREFWDQVQKGNVFAYPAGSEKPVQIQAEIKNFSKPKPLYSKPLDMESEATMPVDPAAQPYRKPGRFVRFLNSFIPSLRRRDCAIYREREKFAAIAKKRAAGMKQELDELEAADKIAAKIEQKQAEKDRAADLERSAGLRKKGKRFYLDTVAPKPVFHKEHEKDESSAKGHYTKAEFNSLDVIDRNYGDYSVGGTPLSEEEYGGIVLACSLDTGNTLAAYKVASGYDPTLYKTMTDMGFSEKETLEIITRKNYTLYADDQMKGDLRDSQGGVLPAAYKPGRKMAFEVLDKYKQGDMGPLAEKIKFEIEAHASTTCEIIGPLSNGARNHAEFTGALVDLLERDPALKKAAMDKGLKQKDIDVIKGLRAYSKALNAAEDAKVKIARAIADDEPLTLAEKQKYAKDILTANLMTAQMTVENTEYLASEQGFGAQLARFQQKSDLEAGEALNGWITNPSTRPFPPKGTFYKEQAFDIVTGMKPRYSQNPESVTDLADPANVAYIRTLADGVTENKLLADMPDRDFLKVLSTDGNVYTGSKLVEEADKVADRLRREELGIADEKEFEALNKSVNYGDKPKAGPGNNGPTA